MRDFLSNRVSILEAEFLALVASVLKELARPKEKAVNITAVNTLRRKQHRQFIVQGSWLQYHSLD